jgi:hypothetical protein
MTVKEAIAHLTTVQHELRTRQPEGLLEKLVLSDGSPVGCFGVSHDCDKVYVYVYDDTPIPPSESNDR